MTLSENQIFSVVGKDYKYTVIIPTILRLTFTSVHLAKSDPGPVQPIAVKRKTEKSFDNENCFRKLIEISRSAVMLLNKDFEITYRNAAAMHISGWDTTKTNVSLLELASPFFRPRISSILNDVLSHPQLEKTISFQRNEPNGTYSWLRVTFTNLLDDINVNAISCSLDDITAEKLRDEQFQKTIKELVDYKHALDESSIIAITDQKGIISYVNDNFCRISKFSVAELIGKDHRIINSSYHPPSFFRDLWRTIGSGSIWKGEIKNKAKDGSYYWVDTTIVPFLDKASKPYQYVAIRSDITTRKESQDRVENSERFIRVITDNLPAMIAYFAADLSCLYANKTYLEWLAKNSDDVIGVQKSFLMDSAEYDISEKYIQRVLMGQKQSFERSIIDGNNNIVYIHTQYVPDIEDGVVKGFYSLLYNISDIKLAGLEVLSKTEQIQSLLENITDGFIALDNNYAYTYVNKRIGQMLNLDPASMIGKNMWELFPEAVGSDTYLAIVEASTTQCTVVNEDYYEPLALWQENRIYPTKQGLSIFIRDITERKQEEIQKILLAETGQLFNDGLDLSEILKMAVAKVSAQSNFCLAEAWLIARDKKAILKIASFSSVVGSDQSLHSVSDVTSFKRGAGIPGQVWETQSVRTWQQNDPDTQFLLIENAHKADIVEIQGVPIKTQGETIGVLLFGRDRINDSPKHSTAFLVEIGEFLGPEIFRKQLELELSQIFTYAPDIICIAGIDGYFKKVNPAMCRILGYSEEELLSTPLLSLVVNEDASVLSEQLNELFKNNRAFNAEAKCFSKHGEVVWLDWTAAPASAEGLLFIIAKDITDKHKLEGLLNKANTLARIGAWEVDFERSFVSWSDITKEIHECAPDFQPTMESGMNFYQEGRDREIITEKVNNAINSGEPWDVELKILTCENNLKWVRVIGEAEMLAGKCVRLNGSFQDIDQRKKSEIMAQEALEERNIILESIDDAFFAVNNNWVVTYWNNKAEQVLLTPKDAILHKNLWDVFSRSVDSISYKNYHIALEKKQAMHFEDYFKELEKWYEISAYPSDNGLSVYFKDITDRKSDMASLKRLNKVLTMRSRDLAISNAELEQYAYVASHDLQEPLRMITNFLDLFEKQYGDIVDERGKKYIYFAVDGAKRMRQIILDLLEFSRIGREDEQTEEVDLNEIVSELLTLYGKDIEEKNAQVNVEELPLLKIYKVPIRQIFQNLISNGLKYQVVGAMPIITITCFETSEYWQFSVEDNGIGIHADYFEKVFNIFQRLHNKDEYSGTGIGLAITKKMVENFGGTIWIESVLGIGSAFHFTIPKTVL